MIPSWVLSAYQDQILNKESSRNAGLDNYTIDVLHFAILFFVIYGLLPIFLHRMKLTHKDVKYLKLIQQ